MKIKGSVYPSASGKSIVIDFYYRRKRYRPNVSMTPTAENLRDCEKILMNIQTAIAMEKMGGKPLNLADFFPELKEKSIDKAIALRPTLDRWLKQHRVKSTTVEVYRNDIGLLCEAFGKETSVKDLAKNVSEIRRQVHAWQDAGVQVKTIHNRLLPLRMMFDMLVESDDVESNPLHRLGAIKPTEDEIVYKLTHDHKDPFDLNEIAAVIEKNSGFAAIQFELAVWTGMRPGELLAIGWDDIDFVHQSAYVWKAIARSGGLVPPKTKGSIRHIDLSRLPRAMDALRRLKEHTFMRDPIDGGKFGQVRFVCYNPTTDAPYLNNKQWRCGQWQPLLRRAGVRYRHPYQSRHTFASICISCGEDENWIVKQLGNSVPMFRRHYAKLIEQVAKASGRHDGARIEKLMEQMK